MANKPQKQAAKQFVEYWTFNRPGSEKSGCQQYWNMLLGKVLGMTELENGIRYEVPVQLKGSTKFLDAWIPSTRVLIEQKSRGVKLDAPQPGHDNMTPFEQAKFYDDHRPFDEKARWIVTCNFDEIWIYDQTKPLDEPEKIRIANLPKEYTRLAFLVNSEVKKLTKRELEISVQAGKIVGTLYDALLKQYAEPDSPETLKALNKLCVRLVFCFYAEDADIFDKNIFQRLVAATPADRLRRTLLTLFQVLDTPTDRRDKYLEPELAAFPYTNGGLYKGATEDEIPPMTEEIKKLLVSSSDFDWNGINTTIFGALFESTLNPETRRAGGMVYTSSENIHKQIDPLFLNDLWNRFYEIVGGTRSVASADGSDATERVPPVLSKSQRKALLELQDDIASLLFLDPASGSGNFLTETFTSLRRLENRIIAAIQGDQPELDLGLRVKVSINQFHGIEINDFAVTVAKTAMWITEAKMARETAEILHREADFLPLKDYDGIVEGNALRMDWSTLLRRTGQVPESSFNYIIGNPPFVGHQYRSKEQAADMDVVFADIADTNYGKLDYVCAWYKKALDLIAGTPTHAAFVSTNSICQGESVAAMWKPLFVKGLEIDFAHRSFVWDSDSFEKAHVHVVIIGFHWNDSAAKGYAPSECEPPKAGAMRAAQRGRKVIFAGENIVEAKNINGYLCDAANVFIQNRGGVNYSWLPKMSKGSQPTDGGNLILSPSEREEIILSHPEAAAFILQYLGSEDFINSRLRYCLWLKGVAPNLYRSIPEVMRRLEAVAEMRRKSPTKSVQRDAETPMLFTQIRQPSTNYMAIPEVSSERRKYVPIGFLTPNVIASSKLYVVPDATLWMFGVLTSIVHMAWMRIVCGRLKSDYSYSPAVYNNFPWPFASSLRPPCGENANDESAKAAIEKTAQGILDARALYPDSSLADLYDPLAMPPELRKAHAANDAAVLKAYGWPTDLSEPEIVSRLFDMYEKLTIGQA